MRIEIPCIAERFYQGLWGIAILVALVVPSPLGAGTVALQNVTVPISFEDGDVAVAEEVNANFTAIAGAVNANFTAIQEAVNDNDARIAELEAAVEALQAALATANNNIVALQMQTSNIQSLNDYVRVDMSSLDGLIGPHVLFEGVNVHIRSGSGATDDGSTLTGLGNLVVGYNEVPVEGLSDGDRGGSHNFIVGREHRYASFAGFVAGFQNTISGPEATVSGGQGNEGSGSQASVSGGLRNMASGSESSVSGGQDNIASGQSASVSGGTFNEASDDQASVSGGRCNLAEGRGASVSGGGLTFSVGCNRNPPDPADIRVGNTASGELSSVSGGGANTASNIFASVSGGGGGTASGPFASVSGGSRNVARGRDASVSGGRCNFAGNDPDNAFGASVSGGGLAYDIECDLQGDIGNTASGALSSIIGNAGNVFIGTIPLDAP